MLSALIVLSFAGEKKRSEQKLTRIHLALPIKLRQLGAVHLIYPVVLWIGILIVYYFFYFLACSFSSISLTIPSVQQMCTLNGLVLCVNALYLINRGILKTSNGNIKKFVCTFLWLCTYVATLLPFYMVINFAGVFGENTSLQVFMEELMNSPFWINFVGIALSVIGFTQFLRMRSYLEA